MAQDISPAKQLETFLGFVDEAKPVSYTHLDVYKRQGLWLPL